MDSGSFNLKMFIQKSSNLIPEHLNSLPKSSYRNLGAQVRKKIILLFLKEYLKHNKDKYSRSQFNTGFVQKFIYQIFPRIAPEDMNISIPKVQITLIDFINYLTLNNVLRRKTEEKIMEEIKISQGINHDEEIHPNKMYFEEMDEDLIESEDFMDTYLKQIDSWVNDMLKNPSKELENYPEDLIYFTIEKFSEDMLYYLSQTHETWDPDDVEYLYCDIYPRKVILEEGDIKAIAPILTSFFTYLGNKGVISNNHANQLKMRLYAIRDNILKLMKDKAVWSFMKTALWEASESGVDIEDERQLNEFLNLKQLEHNYKLIESRIKEEMEKIESYSTETLVQILNEFGIPFQKERFLKKMQEFYTVEELTNHWELKYDIKEPEIYSRVGWMIVRVLWDRMAPDVIHGEKINEIMMQGYSLLWENRFKEACDTWLKTWNFIKQRYAPEITSIKDVDDRFNGGELIHNWAQDFSIELLNQGIREEQYLEERITFSKEKLEFFPDSEDYFIQDVMRDLGETYFYLDRPKKGKEIFKNLIERFPEFTWGYITWGDYYAGFFSDKFDYERARSIYQMALERCSDHIDSIKKRMAMLKEKKDGLEFKESLLSGYKAFLSQKNLSEDNIEEKIDDVGKILDYLILEKEMISLKDMAEKLYPEIILEFLGILAIQWEIVNTKSSMIRLCRSIKSFFKFFEDSMILQEELKEIREICNSKEFFVKRLERFQEKKLHELDIRQYSRKFNEWREENSKWHYWVKLKEEQKERKAKK